MPTIDFWYEFASPYSALAAFRIEREAEAAGVSVAWRPFLLGPIFASQGWTGSPFNAFPTKGAHMWRDLARHGEALGVRFGRPDPFPQNGLLAARIALVAREAGWCADFTRAVYRAEFSDLEPISDRSVMAAIISASGRDPEPVLSSAESGDNKQRLRAATNEAIGRGLFGAPSFTTSDGELFWGNDRLAEALHWARHGSLKGLLAPV